MKFKIFLIIVLLVLISGCIQKQEDNSYLSDKESNPAVINKDNPYNLNSKEDLPTSNHEIEFIFNGYEIKIKNIDNINNILCETDSMRPSLVCGNTILLKKYNLEKDNLSVGDIVVFENKNKENIVHRIINILDNNLQVLTKGDNNLGKDNYFVEKKDIKYIVVGVLFT